MEYHQKEYDKYINEQSLKVLIQRYSVCNGYDYWIREELLKEMRECPTQVESYKP